MPKEGLILNIQRMSTEDGPGLRTTVFFKGCPLACEWCHNPESISALPQLLWHAWKCMGCGSCVGICENKAISRLSDGLVRDPDKCVICGSCVSECPTSATEIVGRSYTLDGLLSEIAKDKAWFGAEGGVTLSGGEPTMQAGFVSALLRRCQATGIHTALDTCGLCGQDVLLDLARVSDLVLFDVKGMDPLRHREHTGHSNDRILDNLRALAALIRERGSPRLWIRTPLIPGATANEADILAIGGFLGTDIGDIVERWELCGFNHLCRDQYKRLGISWSFAGNEPFTREETLVFENIAKRSGIDPNLVHVTGPTRDR